MELLPAIDLRHGRVVRLTRGDDADRTVYSDRPEEVLGGCVAAGAGRVHVVDLDAAFGEPPQRELIASLVSRFGTLATLLDGGSGLQLGGGLRTPEDVAWALETAGCARAVIGSMVGRDPDGFSRLAARYPGRLVPALDVADGAVRLAGWRERADRSLDALCRELRGLPCPAILVTDVTRDGTLDGPNLDLARRVADAAGISVLLSGGVRSLADLETAREVPGIAGAVVGKALYEGVFTVQEALAASRGVEPKGVAV
jgi:phosphoribosylformimino-5-aminoimidazole carboxamide ribotide isomerase